MLIVLVTAVAVPVALQVLSNCPVGYVRSVPSIHDITTDTDDSKMFAAGMILEPKQTGAPSLTKYDGRPMQRDWTGPTNQAFLFDWQKEGYPELAPIRLSEDRAVVPLAVTRAQLRGFGYR